jgi:branched-chain amino acid transport system substrate-binding protein
MNHKKALTMMVVVFLCVAIVEVTLAASPIKVGFLAGLTGPGTTYGVNMMQGQRMAVDEINEAGGLLGRKIEVVVIDDAAQAAQSVSAMTRLVYQDKVDIVIGGWGTWTVLPNLKVCEKAQVPYIVCGGSNPRVTKGSNNQWTFANIIDDDKHSQVSAKIAMDMGYKRIAILHDRNDYGVGLKDAFIKALEKGGLKPVAIESHQTGDKDFTAQLMKIRDAKPDALGLFSILVEGAAVAIQMKKLGMELRIFGMASLSNPNFIKLGGEAVEGAIATTNFARDMSAEAEAWNLKYEKVFAKSTVMLDPVGAWLTYSAVKFPFVNAVKMAGSMDKAKVRDALRQVKWREYGQDIDNYFDKEHALVKQVIVLQVKNGKFFYLKKVNP